MTNRVDRLLYDLPSCMQQTVRIEVVEEKWGRRGGRRRSSTDQFANPRRSVRAVAVAVRHRDRHSPALPTASESN